MGWKLGLLLLGLATIARPQGDIGGTQSPPCTASQGYSYKGCYSDDNNGAHMNFDFQVIPNTTVDKANYPGFGTAITQLSCQIACRGHGYKWAAAYNGSQCYCSSIWAAPNTTYNFSTQNVPQYPLYNPNYVNNYSESTCNK